VCVHADVRGLVGGGGKGRLLLLGDNEHK
jgi:hypothetical protein